MANAVDFQKSRRELLRWYILLTANAGGYLGVSEPLLLSALVGIVPGVTSHEVRRELDYLEHRELLTVSGRDSPAWVAKLTRVGTDVVEYTVPCEAGIARPPKYWGDD